jgi:hypothetical protein
VVTVTRQIALYKHVVALGDLVYFDGSYSDTILEGKTVVAICFYINPENPMERLAVSLGRIVNLPWGLYNNASAGVPNIKLDADAGDTSLEAVNRCYDVQGLTNFRDEGLGQITEAAFRDANTPDGFKTFTNTNQVISDFGFKTLDFDYGAYRQGEKVHAGMYNTLLIMRQRDMVLSGVAMSGFNVNAYYPFAAEDGRSQTVRLQEAIGAIQTAKGTNYQQMYWPAASMCFAYEPTVKNGEKLSDKFKANKWALPSVNELARFFYWDKVDETQNIFALAKSQAVNMEGYGNTSVYASNEHNEESAWWIYIDGRIFSTNYNTAKNGALAVRPIVAF